MLPKLERYLRKWLQRKGFPGAPENASPKTPPQILPIKACPACGAVS